MNHLAARILDQAEADGRFEQVDTDLLEIWLYPDDAPQVQPLTALIGKDKEGQRFDRLNGWLNTTRRGRVDGVQPIGGLQLLIQQSRAKHVTGVTDKIPWANKRTFQAVFKKMRLPLMYVPLLQYCSGVVKLFVTPQTTASATRLEFVCHSSNYHSETWSLALSYSPDTGITTGFFSLDAGMKPGAILDHLKASASLAHHPMLLPLILFRILIESSIKHRGKLHGDLYTVEKELGYLESGNHSGQGPGAPTPFSYPLYDAKRTTNFKSRDIEKGIRENPRAADESKHTAEYFQDISRRLNTCKKQIAGRYSRQGFWKRYRGILLEAFDAMEHILPGERIQQIADAQSELRYWTSVEGALFESLDGRDMHYNARIETQLGVVSVQPDCPTRQPQPGEHRGSGEERRHRHEVLCVSRVVLPTGEFYRHHFLDREVPVREGSGGPVCGFRGHRGPANYDLSGKLLVSACRLEDPRREWRIEVEEDWSGMAGGKRHGCETGWVGWANASISIPRRE